MKPTETFADFFYRTRGHHWGNVPAPHFADGLVAYVEDAVARLEKSNPEVALDTTRKSVSDKPS